MSVRPFLLRLLLPLLLVLVPLFPRARVSGQAPPATLTIVAREPHRPIPITMAGNLEFVPLDELAGAFQLTVREEAGAITVTSRGRTIVLTPDQTMASVAGRVISLPAPPARVAGRWMVPLDFIPRALAGIYDQRLELRRASHLVIVGDLRVPRLVLRQEAAGPGARITLESLPRTAATVTQDGAQLLVRFEADGLDTSLPPAGVAGMVQSYRLMEPATIALDLGPRFGSFRTVTQITDAGIALLVDLLPPQATEPPATTQVDPALPPTPPAATVGLPSLESLARGFRTIVIDPGHGGGDTGAKGAKGTLEKDVTLAMARRLKSALEGRFGVRVLLTRDDDRAVPIADRTAVANNNKADLFISLHANASPLPTVGGATVYTAAFTSEQMATRSAAIEQLPAFGGGTRDIELVPWNLAQARHVAESEALARFLVEAFQDQVTLSGTPKDSAPLRVLQAANMPAVLVETGFVTNPAQESQLAGTAFQVTLAQRIVEAIARFRTETLVPEGTGR